MGSQSFTHQGLLDVELPIVQSPGTAAGVLALFPRIVRRPDQQKQIKVASSHSEYWGCCRRADIGSQDREGGAPGAHADLRRGHRACLFWRHRPAPVRHAAGHAGVLPGCAREELLQQVLAATLMPCLPLCIMMLLQCILKSIFLPSKVAFCAQRAVDLSSCTRRGLRGSMSALPAADSSEMQRAAATHGSSC